MKALPKLNSTWILFSCVLLLLCTTGCDPYRKIDQNHLYFQNDRANLSAAVYKELAIQPNDLLSVLVFSKSLNQQQAEIFNLPAADGYLTSADGYLEMPVVGQVKAAGLTRQQLQNVLQQKLLPYVKDPSVVVRFKSFKISVLGEVNAPGVQNYPVDRVTLLDAIATAGDLTVSGRRDNVTVIREEADGRRHLYEVDLQSLSNLYKSPAFQLQQNDLVYVNADKRKLKQIKEKNSDNGRVLQWASLGLGIVTSALFIILQN